MRRNNMSGGSYNYICCTLSNECEGAMYDEEMNDLIKDLCEVLHDLEWWQSGDCREEKYKETLLKFKQKWFKQCRDERLKEYVDNKLNKTRKELYSLIGIEEENKK